jgi:hypothetical protein
MKPYVRFSVCNSQLVCRWQLSLRPIYGREMKPGENPDDLYYLYWTKRGLVYIVFETDRIGSLGFVAEADCRVVCA